MSKIAYSLILLLSVSCLSSATESASSPEKQETTVSQEKGADKQDKDFASFAIQLHERINWVCINTAFLSLIIFGGSTFIDWLKKSKILDFEHDIAGLLIVVLSPFLVTAMTTLFNTFINGEKEVTQQGKRPSFMKRFGKKWGYTLLITILSMIIPIGFNQILLKIDKDHLDIFSSSSGLMIISFLVSSCLVATFISYMKLSSDDPIKLQKKATKTGFLYFLTQWASYSNDMFIYNIIIGSIIDIASQKYKYAPSVVYAIVLSSIIVLTIVRLSASIFYKFEKKKAPSKPKAFSNYLLPRFICALLSIFLTSFSVALFIKKGSSKRWIKNLSFADKNADNISLFALVYPSLVSSFIIAPVLALIEMYRLKKTRTRLK